MKVKKSSEIEKKRKITWKKVVLYILLLCALFIIGIRLNSRYNRGPTGQEVAVGETLRVGHMSYTINDMETAEIIMIDGEERGVTDGAFLIVDVTVRNHQFSGALFFHPNVYFQAEGKYYPTADDHLGIAEAVAEEREAYAFERYQDLERRETLDGILVFIISQEWLDSEDAALYFYSEKWWGEQDGYIYFH